MGPTGEQASVRPGAAMRGARLGDPDALLPPADNPARQPPPAAPPAEAEAGRLDAMRARVEVVLGAIDRRAREWHEARERDWQEMPRIAVELAVAVAARLLHDRFTAGDYPVEALAREMLGAVGDAPAVVYLHPDDLALLGQRPADDRPGPFRYQADPALGRGDCRIEAGDTILLSELAVRMVEARRRLLEGLGHARG